jgi:hypothetical protein
VRYTSVLAILIVMLLSFRQKEPVQPTPSRLVGNWKTIPNGQPNLRWTFDQTTAYQTWQWTGVDSCMVVTPNISVLINPYIVRNDTLIFEWYDHHFLSHYIYYPIKILTQERLILTRSMSNGPDATFEHCP